MNIKFLLNVLDACVMDPERAGEIWGNAKFHLHMHGVVSEVETYKGPEWSARVLNDSSGEKELGTAAHGHSTRAEVEIYKGK